MKTFEKYDCSNLSIREGLLLNTEGTKLSFSFVRVFDGTVVDFIFELIKK